MATTKRYFLVDKDKNIIKSSEFEIVVDLVQLNEKTYYITREWDGYRNWHVINESYDERQVVVIDLPYSNDGLTNKI